MVRRPSGLTPTQGYRLNKTRCIKPWVDWLPLEPYALEAFDSGYASEDFDGPNHVQVGVDLTAALTEKVSVVGSIAHSWALKEVELKCLGDQSWASLGLFAEF